MCVYAFTDETDDFGMISDDFGVNCFCAFLPFVCWDIGCGS